MLTISMFNDTKSACSIDSKYVDIGSSNFFFKKEFMMFSQLLFFLCFSLSCLIYLNFIAFALIDSLSSISSLSEIISIYYFFLVIILFNL